MAVVSYPHLILSLLLLISYTTANKETDKYRQRRQAALINNYNAGGASRNSDGSMSQNNVQYNPSNNQQQSSQNQLPSSQGQGAPVRSRGFYDSPDFKPPSFSGGKPVGWFDTKYPNWVSNQAGQADKNGMIDGKNAPPSSLLGKAMPPQREDGGLLFLQKLGQTYASRGEKTYNFDQSNAQRASGSVCTNQQSFNGYTFNRFVCPLPPNTGMNQQDRFCCGSMNNQYCCNQREFNQYQSGGYDDSNYDEPHRHSKHSHYVPSRNRGLAILLPIVGVLVVAGALVIVFLYYKKLRNEQNKSTKTPVPARNNDDYSAVPQNAPVERPIAARREGEEEDPTDRT